jgi:glucosamine 6-phosphate synthetase-like amidotransferase/phosphosugar isomerase protein
MCIIAGYSGNKSAAPILIEMMKKEEFYDGGLSTGIATIHEGKLYCRKVVGDVDTLLRETDAIDLPGTTGIIHSRTGGNSVAHAQPVISRDGNMALITNGTTKEATCPEFYETANALMADLVNKGYTVNTAFDYPEGEDKKTQLPNGKGYQLTEPYLFTIEELLKKSDGKNLKSDIAKATRTAIDTLPRNFITLNVNANVPNTITIGNIARPMTAGFGDGEVFLASVPMALPDEVQKRPVIHLPTTSVTQVTPEGIKICSTSLENVRVEDVDYRIAGKLRAIVETMLKGKKDAPVSIYDILAETDWTKVWSEPYIDSKFVGTGYLKPYAGAIYNALFSFHKEGRLHTILGKKKGGSRIVKYWLD